MLASDFLKRGWTKGEAARNARGTPVDVWHPDARAWCSVGAVYAAKIKGPIFLSLCNYYRHRYGVSMTKYNDKICASQQEAVDTMMEAEQAVGWQS